MKSMGNFYYDRTTKRTNQVRAMIIVAVISPGADSFNVPECAPEVV